MADLTTFLDSKVGRAAPTPPPTNDGGRVHRTERGVSGQSRFLDDMVASFEQIDDVGIRSIAKSLVEVELSRTLGFNFEFPDEQDLELKSRRDRAELIRLSRQEAQFRVDLAKSLIRDDPGSNEQFGGNLEDIFADPKQLVAQANAIGFGELGFGSLTEGDFELAGDDLAGVSQGDVQRQQQEQAVDDTKTALTGLESTVKLQEAVSEGVGSDILTGLLQQAQEATGLDLINNARLDDIDIDEPSGALALFTVTDSISRQVPGAESVVLTSMLGNSDVPIADQLEELVDDNGILQIGETSDVKSEASFWLTALLLRIRKRTNMTVPEVLQRAGINAIGVDEQGFRAAAHAEAAQRGVDPNRFLSELDVDVGAPTS